MSRFPPAAVHRRVQSAVLATALVVIASAFDPTDAHARQAAAREFTGAYVGVELGALHVIGGSLVSGVDVLAEDTRAGLTAFGGLRYEFGNRLVIGGELGIGAEDADLSQTYGSPAAVVEYRNGSHTRYGGLLGVVVGAGRRTLVFGYVNELTRSFDVVVTTAAGSVDQQDEQGLLRFGGGVERAVTRHLSFRITAGTARADFGDRPTNVDVARRLEAAAGVVWRF